MKPFPGRFLLPALAAGALVTVATVQAQQGDGPCVFGPGYGYQQGPGGYDYGPGAMGSRGMMGPGNMPWFNPEHIISRFMMGPGMGQSPNQGMGPGRFMGRLIDDNGDGIIGDDEVAARHEEVFAAMDSDDDGKLSDDEFISGQMGLGRGAGPRHEQRQARKRERFQALDNDDDGSVSQSEFMTAGQQRFAASDQDQDGKVSVWEFRSQRRAWQ